MSVRFTKLWKFQSSGRAPIYSSPIVASVGGEQCLVFQAWDWFIYVIRCSDGSVKWKYPTGAPCYGRCQAADVDNDGHTEIFGASHDGHIYCLNYDGTLRYTVPNLWASTKISGVASSGAASTLTDSSRVGAAAWLTNCFTRIQGAGFGAKVTITSGTGVGQTREIQSNTATVLTVTAPWGVNPDATSHYSIAPYSTSDIEFQHAGTLLPMFNINAAPRIPSNTLFTFDLGVSVLGAVYNYNFSFKNVGASSVGVQIFATFTSPVTAGSVFNGNGTFVGDGVTHVTVQFASLVANTGFSIDAKIPILTKNGVDILGTAASYAVPPWTVNSSAVITPKYELYAAGFDNIARKIDPTNGTVIWEYFTGENNEAYPTLGQIAGLAGTVHCAVGSVSGYVYLLNGDDGTLAWSKKVDVTNGEGIDAILTMSDVNADSSLDIIVPVRRGGLVGGGGKMHYLKGIDGTDLHQTVDLGGDIDSKPLVTPFGIVVGCDSGKVGSFDNSATTQWLNSFGQVFNSSAIFGDIDADGTSEIIICDMNGIVYLLDYTTGKVKSQFMLDGPIEGIPYLDDETHDGLNMRLYVPTKAGSLFKLSATAPPKMKISPDSANYTDLPGHTSQVTQLDGGMPRTRLDQIGAGETITVQWTTGPNGFDYLKAFYRTSTQFGSLPFNIDLVLDTHNPATYLAYFVPDTFQLNSQQGLTYIVQATLSVKPLAVDATADTTLVNNYVATT